MVLSFEFLLLSPHTRSAVWITEAFFNNQIFLKKMSLNKFYPPNSMDSGACAPQPQSKVLIHPFDKSSCMGTG